MSIWGQNTIIKASLVIGDDIIYYYLYIYYCYLCLDQ